MTNMTVLDVAAAAMATSGSTTAAQPSAQAVARFEQQLHAPSDAAQLYGAPVEGTAGMSEGWQSVVGHVGQISQQFRIDSKALESPLGLDADNSVAGFRQSMSQVTHMSYTMLSVNLVTSAERVAGENVRSLFQLS
jgi:hypothetical protein